MANEDLSSGNESGSRDSAELGKKLSAIGWSLFFIWVGVAFLMDLDTSIGLLGVGVITLGMQLVRKSSGLALEGFWVCVGLLFVLGSIWARYELDIPIVPILLILGGAILLISTLRSKRGSDR
jgi:hypothetical protein